MDMLPYDHILNEVEISTASLILTLLYQMIYTLSEKPILRIRTSRLVVWI